MVPKCERLVEILNFLSCIKEIIGIGNKNRCLPAPQRQIYVSYATTRIVLVKDNIPYPFFVSGYFIMWEALHILSLLLCHDGHLDYNPDHE